MVLRDRPRRRRIARNSCRPGPVPGRGPGAGTEPNIFSIAQENDLGDAIAERYESWLRVIDDDTVTPHLADVGVRLVSHLPPSDLHFQFRLIDIPDANAFALAGGRVYVSRKLIASTRSEDELAGVMGHELGHLVARQHTIDMTRQLKDVVGVTEVGDRNDIFAKYNRLMDNAARKPGVFGGADRERRDQVEADRIGLFIVAASGYDPKAFVTLFDRLFATGGKTGSVVSRMFGTTSPDAKRLGEMVKAVGTLPAGCAEATTPARDQAYREWQAAVVASSVAARKESLPGLASQKDLAPLREEVTRLRFSPDGRFLIAQDDAGISVLSREPLAVLFRIDAPDAQGAQFTTDSADVVFHTSDLRVERWNVATRKLTEVRDLYWQTVCRFTALAPDGRTIACLDANDELSLIDVATGQAVFQKKGFESFNPTAELAALLGGVLMPRTNAAVTMGFSPDGRFFVAGSQGYASNSAIAYDLTNRGVITLKGSARNMVTSAFAFIGPDRLVGFNVADPGKSGVVRFPAGEVGETFTLTPGGLEGATKGDVVFIRPFQKYAVGVFDLSRKLVVKGNASEAIDVYGDAFAAERGTGDLGLYAMDGNQVRASVSLPFTSLARVRTAAVSADFKWVALSARTRGVMWDTGSGERVAMVRDFDGAFIDDAGTLFADLPKAGADPRAIMRLDGPSRVVGGAGQITEPYASQYGRRLMVVRLLPPNTMRPTGLEFEVRDVRTATALWKKGYAKNPPDDFWPGVDSDALVLSWAADSAAGREVPPAEPGPPQPGEDGRPRRRSPARGARCAIGRGEGPHAARDRQGLLPYPPRHDERRSGARDRFAGSGVGLLAGQRRTPGLRVRIVAAGQRRHGPARR